MENALGAIRFVDEQKYGLCHRYIFGLNLFAQNSIRDAIAQRPDVTFLKQLTETQNCSAQVSAIYINDHATSPHDIFGQESGAISESANLAESTTPYTLVNQVGFRDDYFDLEGGIEFGGQLIDGAWVSGNKHYGDCFFPLITNPFWEALEREPGARDQLLIDHSLVLYIGPASPNAARALEQYLGAPFVNEHDVLNVAASLYAVVLLAGHDGQYWHAFARDAANFGLLDTSLSLAIGAIEATDWFQSNRRHLVWGDDLERCLMLTRQADLT